MPVRIFFRGLVLFRFPQDGPDAGKLVAELITEPDKQPPGPHHHQTEVQILTGERAAAPRNLRRGQRIDITIPGKGEVTRSPSFVEHVPKLSAIAARSSDPSLQKGPTGPRNSDYVRNTITVNRGTIRVGHLVTWDEGGFPIGGKSGHLPAQPVEVKFLGSEFAGHVANDCVLEVLDADEADVSGPAKALVGRHRSKRAPNPYTASDSVEILVTNFEFQRARPVPWAMDFQWFFLASGYAPVNLSGTEFTQFRQFASGYDHALFNEDRATLMPNDPMGLPFPYLTGNPRIPLKPLSEIDSRPLCVPGDGE